MLTPRFFTCLFSKAGQRARLVVLISLSFFVVACGGGGSDDAGDMPATDPIRVNAGVNLTLNENESAEITGGSSGGSGAITYRWQADASIAITLPDNTSPNASLTAPTLSQITEYTVTLVATDSAGSAQSDSFTLTVNPVNIDPVARITSNQVDGYGNRQFPVTSLIQLDGSSSSDEDPLNAEAPIGEFNWQQIAGPSLLAGINTSQAAIQLVSPIIDSNTQATIRLTVTDQELAQTSTEINLTLLGQSDTLPSAQINAVPDVFSGEIVKLSGSATSLAPNAAPFTAAWQASTSGQANNAQINNVGEFSTHAISPLVTTNTNTIYTLEARDSFGNIVTVQTTGQVFSPQTRVINDTGVTQFASNDSVFARYQEDFTGQDADYGADRQTASGQVIKVGDGDQGFDFTRLDDNGDVIDNPSFTFNCVRDNVSGLIWQVKDNINTTNINYVDQTFTWYLEDDNGNFAGDTNDNSSSCNTASMQCNTQAYVDQINTQGMCGFFDWRLPTPSELQSIIHYGKTTPPLVDTVFFPFWGNNNSQPLWYWTLQSSADGVNDDTAMAAWAFDMHTGNDAFLVKSSQQRVILVRAGR
jgi:chitinase